MKKYLATLIIGLFLSLAFSHAGFADSRGSTGSNDISFLQQWGKSPSFSAFLSFENKDFALFHFPFIRSKLTKSYKMLTDYFSLVDAFLAAKDQFWEEIAQWHPGPSFNGSDLYKPTTIATRKDFDSNALAAQDHMGISLNHDVGEKKTWSLSLDLGIALQNDHIIGPDHRMSDDLFPKLGMAISNQSEDFFDQLRNASPFIGFGVSCRF